MGLGALGVLGLIFALRRSAKAQGRAEAENEQLSAEKEAAKRIVEAESRSVADSDALLDELRDKRRKL